MRYSGILPNIAVKKETNKPAKIGHAVHDENGKLKGGKAGDQNGKEVLIQDFIYSSNPSSHRHWVYVARAKSSEDRKTIANTMKACTQNNNIGYDQSQRTTLYEEAKKVDFVIENIKTKCETDCSATVRTCLAAAGISVPKGFRTKNMYEYLKETNKFTIYKYSKVKNSLEVGDILWKPKAHTAVLVQKKTTVTENVIQPLKKGDKRKTEVKRLQKFLNWYGNYKLVEDGVFGTNTLKAIKDFQKKQKITVDGIFGSKSLEKAKTINK